MLINFAMFPNKGHILSAFSPGPADWLLSAFFLFLFRFLPKFKYFATLLQIDLLRWIDHQWIDGSLWMDLLDWSELSLNSCETFSFNVFVSVNRKRIDIKMLLCLSDPVLKSIIWAHAQVQFFCFRLEIHFLGKFGQKYQNCQFELKFST